MGAVTIRNVPSFIAELRQEVKRLEQEAVGEVKIAAQTLVTELMSKTPVWSGETVRNYAVILSTGGVGGPRAPTGGDPGPTNTMPLGVEPRRAENELAAWSEINSVLAAYSKLGKIRVVNRIAADKWDLIDGGSAPTPQMARYPGAVALRAMQSARGKLRNFK